MSADFDRYGSSYADEVERAIAFAGTDAAFFTELKAADLVALASRRFQAPGNVRALDFGCGTGALDALIAPKLGAVTGIDVSNGLLEVAAAENPGVEYRHYDGGVIPYPDASFDLAFASCVLHHIDPADRARAASELARVLRPGGVVAIYEHNPLNPLTRVAVSRCEFDEGVELLRPSETTGLLGRAGLAPVESRYIVFFPWRGRGFRVAERGLARLPLGAQYVVAAAKVGSKP
jgi:SAM-dependent methyltransferase